MESKLLDECRRLGIKVEIFATDKDITVTLINDEMTIFAYSSTELSKCEQKCVEFLNDLGL